MLPDILVLAMITPSNREFKILQLAKLLRNIRCWISTSVGKTKGEWRVSTWFSIEIFEFNLCSVRI